MTEIHFQQAISFPEKERMPRSLSLARFFQRVIDASLWLAVFLVPLIYLSPVADVLDWNKQMVLFVVTIIAAIASVGKAFAERKIEFAWHWSQSIVLLFLVAFLGSSVLSSDNLLSLIGNTQNATSSLIVLFALVVFYFVLVNQIRSQKQISHLLFAYFSSSALVALVSLLAMFAGFSFLPASFNPIGSAIGLSVYLTASFLMAVLYLSTVSKKQDILPVESGLILRLIQVAIWACAILSFAVLVTIDYTPTWILLIVGLVLAIGLDRLRFKKLRIVPLIVSGILIVISLIFWRFQTPVPMSFPTEVAPKTSASWEIAQKTLVAHPVLGSGPGTWGADYMQYRPQAVNFSPFWNQRFSSGSSAFMTLLPTVGILGIMIWLVLLFVSLFTTIKTLRAERVLENWDLIRPIFVGFVVTVLFSFIFTQTLSQVFVLWLFLALLGSYVADQTISWRGEKPVLVQRALGFVLLVAVISGGSCLWLLGERFVAEARYAEATTIFQAQNTSEKVIPLLEQAVSLNPMSDVYARSLSQAHLFRAASMVKAKPTADQITQIQSEVGLAVRYGLQARDLSPANVDNWANAGLIYENIAGFTQGADESAIKQYQEAHVRDPQNPIYVDAIGKLYILRADAYRSFLEAKDKASRDEAKRQMDANLKQAEAALRLAVALKPDYFPARYHLGIVFERSGRIPEAIRELQSFLVANPKDVGVGFELALLDYRMDKKDEALQLLQQIIAIDPTQANARWYLAAMLTERGKFADAIAQLEVLLKQMPGNAAVQAKITELQQALTARSRPVIQTLPEPLPDTPAPAPTTPTPTKKTTKKTSTK